jgi:hypothetical protein
VDTYAELGVGGGQRAERRRTPWGEMALAAVAGGLIVATGFALFTGRTPRTATAPGAARLQQLVARAHLSAREEQTVRAALGEARTTGKAAVAYLSTQREDDGHGDASDLEQAEVEAIVEAVVTERLAAELDQRRLAPTLRHLTPVTSWLALDVQR